MLFRTRPTPTPASRWLATAAALALLATGCSKTEPAPVADPGPGAAPSATAAPEADTATAPEDVAQAQAPVIATVAGRPITADAVAAAAEQLGRERRVPPSERLVHDALDALIADAIVAAEARTEGFGESLEGRQITDSALASAYLDAKTRAEAEASVTDEDLARYFAPRRRAAKLVVATREDAAALQATIQSAIATTPERFAEVFADFRAQRGLDPQDQDFGATTPFDDKGQGPMGEPITPPLVAGAAFALGTVGAVSPPIPVPPDRFALVQLLELVPAPAAVSPEDKDRARQALVAARAHAARQALLVRLKQATIVTIDQARASELATTLAKGGLGGRRRIGVEAMQLRRDRLRRLPSQIRRPELSKDAEALRRAVPEEIQRKMHPPTAGDATP